MKEEVRFKPVVTPLSIQLMGLHSHCAIITWLPFNLLCKVLQRRKSIYLFLFPSV